MFTELNMVEKCIGRQERNPQRLKSVNGIFKDENEAFSHKKEFFGCHHCDQVRAGQDSRIPDCG